MSRIRAIKPSYFKNEDLCALSPWHRLAFAGLWVEADREGRLEDRPKRLKVEIFPYDDEVDMDHVLAELAGAGFIDRYQVAGRRYIAIPSDSWKKHQRPRQDEAASVIPPPPGLTESSPNATVTDPALLSDEPDAAQCIGKGKGKGKWEEGEDGDSAPSPLSSCGLQLQQAWNDATKPPIPRCREITLQREKRARVRLRERPIDDWHSIFARVQASPFCRGENDRGWRADFDWATKPESVVKIMEGKYDPINGEHAPHVDQRAAVAKEQYAGMRFGR